MDREVRQTITALLTEAIRAEYKFNRFTRGIMPYPAYKDACERVSADFDQIKTQAVGNVQEDMIAERKAGTLIGNPE